MDIFKIIGFGLISALLILFIKQYKPEYALLLAAAAGCILIGVIVLEAYPALFKLKEYLNDSSIKSFNFDILVKALGIAFLTQFAVDICNDSGASSIASKIELSGKIAILVLALPLFEKLSEIVIYLIKR